MTPTLVLLQREQTPAQAKAKAEREEVEAVQFIEFADAATDNEPAGARTPRGATTPASQVHPRRRSPQRRAERCGKQPPLRNWDSIGILAPRRGVEHASWVLLSTAV